MTIITLNIRKYYKYALTKLARRLTLKTVIVKHINNNNHNKTLIKAYYNINLAQVRDQWMALVKTVMNHRFHNTLGIS
jgi:hypothetical protein